MNAHEKTAKLCEMRRLEARQRELARAIAAVERAVRQLRLAQPVAASSTRQRPT